jgi:hypothetical protein
MEYALEILKTAFAKSFGTVLGAVMVYGVLALLVVMLAAPVYFLLRRRVPVRVVLRWGEAPGGTLRFHDSSPAEGESLDSAGPALGSVPAPADDPGRTEFLRRLDAVDRVATSFYEVLMYVAIAGMTGLAVFFYLVIPDDGNRDFLLLYGGVVYLIGMLWATGQLYWIRRRRVGEPARSVRAGLSQLGSKMQIDVQTAEPQVFSLDRAALDRAAQHMAAGGTLDEACALVAPQYASMNGIVKAVFRKAVEAALEARPRS